MKQACIGAAALSAAGSAARAAAPPLNVMLFTADDLHRDSLGCYGSKVPEISPNLDAFARSGLRFTNAHVSVAICQPSRGVLATGLYGHNSGVMGFMKTERPVPTIIETLGAAGYLTGVLGKVGHSTPKTSIAWDFSHDQKELGNGRSPQKYYAYCKEFLARCRKENKPFYFMVNSHDPHRPFHVPGKKAGDAEEPSRLYQPAEIAVPGFVPDLPDVRQELAWYYNSTKRLDDTFGAVMRALDEAGYTDNTLVMFLSDNGIAIPFAKCNAYLASTRTPWLVRWPGKVKPGTLNEDFISGIDFFPTVLDALGRPPLESADGKSFLPILAGKKQPERTFVFTQIDSKAGGAAVPMRCIQNTRFGYIYNMWVRDDYYYRNNNEGETMKAMDEAAKTDPRIAERVRMFRYRDLEEFYDLQNDPDCLNNLIAEPKCKPELDQLRAELAAQMKASNDPLLEAFENRHSPEIVQKVFAKVYPSQKTEKTPKNKNAKKQRVKN